MKKKQYTHLSPTKCAKHVLLYLHDNRHMINIVETISNRTQQGINKHKKDISSRKMNCTLL